MLTWKVVQFFKLKCDDAHDHYHAKLNDKRSYLSELLTALCMPDIIPLNLVWFYRFVNIQDLLVQFDVVFNLVIELQEPPEKDANGWLLLKYLENLLRNLIVFEDDINVVYSFEHCRLRSNSYVARVAFLVCYSFFILF